VVGRVGSHALNELEGLLQRWPGLLFLSRRLESPPERRQGQRSLGCVRVKAPAQRHSPLEVRYAAASTVGLQQATEPRLVERGGDCLRVRLGTLDDAQTSREAGQRLGERTATHVRAPERVEGRGQSDGALAYRLLDAHRPSAVVQGRGVVTD